MKPIKLLLIGLLVLNYCLLFSKEVYIYDELGNKIYFQKIESVKFITINSSTNLEQREHIRQSLKQTFADNFQERTPLLYKIALKTEQELKLFSSLQRETKDVCISAMLMYSDSTVQWTSNEIIVKIFPDTKIEDLLRKHSIPYKNTRQIGSDLQTFVVTLTSVEDKTIEYSNLLYESGNVVFAQPSFWRAIKPSNAFYTQQWGLNNTGQNGGTLGIDINAPEAWQLSTGAGIKVAVLDEGVDLTHPDLDANLLPGYDATDGLWGGSNGGHKGDDAHGTACAGIIAAENNNEGVKGVAYNAKIIPIRIAYKDSYDEWFMNDAWTIDGIYNAWYNKNADVLSNSWDGGSYIAAISYEINKAVTQGRNGKGCILVFSSMNNNASTVSYPGNLSNVVAVGAISPCGERKRSTHLSSQVGTFVYPDPQGVSCDGETSWGSNYGIALDVVAPGVLIPTTDIQGNAGYNKSTGVSGNYYTKFGGTSAACPHVAGIAALILSVNPDLTAKQVQDIIESTAQKVSDYTYANFATHPNGPWHEEMGYGLVDAYGAVEMAMNMSCNSISLTGIQPPQPQIYRQVTCQEINIDATVSSSTKLKLNSLDGEVNLNAGFEVQTGAELEINILQ